jgi:hypothetical protein
MSSPIQSPIQGPLRDPPHVDPRRSGAPAGGRRAWQVTIPRRVWLLAAAVALITAIPYLIGWLSTPQGRLYSGALADLPDYYSHLAKMQQGLRGAWLYQLLFTSEPHPAILLQTFYIGLGHLARWTGAPLPLMYHIARIFFTMLMVIALYGFARRFLSSRAAWWAVALAIGLGGFGFLLYVLPGTTISPIELWLIDAYILFSAFMFPHFAAAIALIAFTLTMLDAWTIHEGGFEFGAFIVGSALLGFLQPFHLLLVGLLMGGLILIRRPASGIFALQIFGAVAALIVGGQLAALNSDPVWAAFSAQNVTLSPNPAYYLLGWFPLIVPAALDLVRLGAAWRAGADRPGQGGAIDRLLLPALWALVAFVLLFVPLNQQRRFSLAYQLPIAILAVDWFIAVGLPWLRRRVHRRWRAAALLYIAIGSISTIIVYASWVNDARRPVAYSPDEQAILGWIRASTQVGDVILASDAFSGAIVGETGRPVVAGHWAETRDYPAKQARVERFFALPGRDDPYRAAVLSEYRVAYVVVENPAATWPPQPNMPACMRVMLDTPTARIFHVEPPCAATSP